MMVTEKSTDGLSAEMEMQLVGAYVEDICTILSRIKYLPYDELRLRVVAADVVLNVMTTFFARGGIFPKGREEEGLDSILRVARENFPCFLEHAGKRKDEDKKNDD